MCYNGFTCMLQIYVPNVSFVFKRMLQVFSSGCCKTSLGGCKSTSAFQIPRARAKQSERKLRAHVERIGRDGPTGPPHACNGAGGAARETEWGGADLPRVRADGAEQGATSGRPGTRRSGTTMY